MKALRNTIAVLIAVLAVTLVPVATAQAAPFTMSIDNAILDLGTLKGVRAIDPELEPPDPPATLSGDLTGTTVNIPKAGFVFPEKVAEVTAGITATINMEANSDITGTFDAGTGKLVLDASLKATVGVLGSDCVISPIVLQLSSDSSNPYLGSEFSSGLEGVGAFGANWATLPPVTGGGSCSIVGQLTGGAGGIAMSHGIRDFKTCETDQTNPRCGMIPDPPTAKPKLVTTPPSTTTSDVAAFTFEKGDGETEVVTGFDCKLDEGEFQKCDSGSKTFTGLAEGSHTLFLRSTNDGGSGPEAFYTWTVEKSVPPPPDPAELGALSVSPKTKKVKRGKSVTVTAKVKNVGGKAASGVKICVTAPKKLVKVKKCVTKGSLGAGATATAKFKVTVSKKARRKAKAVLKFKASGAGVSAKGARAVIRVG